MRLPSFDQGGADAVAHIQSLAIVRVFGDPQFSIGVDATHDVRNRPHIRVAMQGMPLWQFLR